MKNFWRAALPALISWWIAAPASAVGQLADVAIVDRQSRRVLPVYVHEGRHYFAGQPGREYEIRLRNRQPADLLTVLSVDGVDVITGSTADWNESGYVLSARQTYGIRGWRKSMAITAAFYFTALPDSYAARTGRPDNVGVIGVAVFRRGPTVLLPQPSWSPFHLEDRRRESAVDAGPSSGATPAVPSATLSSERLAAAQRDAEERSAAQKSERLGTGHGRSEVSQVVDAVFDRASAAPAEIIRIYYDSYRNLVAQGVIAVPPVARPAPEPFPPRFVPDPL